MDFTKRARALKTTLYSLSQVIREKERGVVLGFDPEDLHDFRVALRRTRTAVSVLEKLELHPQINDFKKDFSWLASHTDTRRDLDVFLRDLTDYIYRRSVSEKLRLSPLVDLLRHLRLVEHSKLVVTMTSRRYSDLLDRWERFLASKSRKQPLSVTSKLARESVADAASRLLENTQSSRTGESIKELHRVRIRCKKLRYTLEFFRDSLPKSGLDHQVRRLKRLQSCLGRVNDFEVQLAWLKDLTNRLDVDGAYLAGTSSAIELLRGHLIKQQTEYIAKFRHLISEFSSQQHRAQLEDLVALPLDAASS